MPNKKLSKSYFGLSKTPIDDNIIAYIPLDGDTKELISGQTLNLGTGSFKPMPTGLGYKFNGDSATLIPIAFNVSEGSVDVTLNFDDVIISGNAKNSIFQLLNINGYRCFELSVAGVGGSNTITEIRSQILNTEGTTIAIRSATKAFSSRIVGMHHFRITWSISKSLYLLYMDGILVSTSSYLVGDMLTPTSILIGSGRYNLNSGGLPYSHKGSISDLSISNIDRGAYFPTLPQDFIDQQATIRPAFSSQRSVYSDALTSETRSTIARIGQNEKQFTNSRLTGNWTSGDTIKVKGLGGEIIGGVIDSDTAFCNILYTDGVSPTIKVSSTAGILANDLVYFVYPSGVLGSSLTVSSVDATNNTLTFSGAINTAYNGGYLVEATTSTSSPLVKANITGTAQAGGSTTITLPTTFSATDSIYNTYDIMITSGTGIGQRRTISAYVGSTKVATVSAWTTNPDSTSVFVIYNVPITGTWSALGTNEATFTFGTNATLINQDILIDYSLNEVAGQGQTELFTKTLGAEYNGRKLVVGTVAVRDDFANKISGSVVECPHIAKLNYTNSVLLPPINFSMEANGSSSYDKIITLNGVNGSIGASTNGVIPQQLFSFNLIRLIQDKYGEIPSLDPVKWVKDNIKSITANWYGYGSCPSGNKAYLDAFKGVWSGSPVTTNASSASLLSWSFTTPTQIGLYIDSNGFANYLAYTDASDGTTASTIYTDYIYLDVVLNTPSTSDVLVPENPRRDSKFGVKSSDLVVVDDFDGKIAGDVNRVGHIMKEVQYSSIQTPSSGNFTENVQLSYTKVSAQDGDISTTTTTITNGNIPQRLFSKNIIRIVEDKYGVIPVVDKAGWLKANLGSITCNWTGYGSCPSGNKAVLGVFNVIANVYSSTVISNTSNQPTILSYTITTPATFIDTNGFAHFLAYTDASDGTTASVINTDYVNISVTLKDSTMIQLPLLKSKLGNENILLVRKETKEIQTFFKSNNDAKISVFGEYNASNHYKVSTLLNGGSILSTMKVFLTSISTKLANNSAYNAKTKFDILDMFSIIDSTISSSNTNGLNLYVNSSYTNLVSNLLETKVVGYNSSNKGIKIGKILTATDKSLQLEDSTGSVGLYIDLSYINNSLSNYIPIACFLAKTINGEIVMVVCGFNATSKGQLSLDGTNGRVVVISLPNKPLIK